MRTLNAQELNQISGGKVNVVVDVNVPQKYVLVNVVNGTQVYTLVKVDWSKWGKQPATGAA